MARPPRVDVSGLIYHILNRANARAKIFFSSDDYRAFERVLTEAKERTGVRLFAYTVMPNHWHLAIRPKNDGDLSKFVGWLAMTHTQRWHGAHGTTGSGHLYQSRYKSFIVQRNRHFLQLCRYIEQNPLRAGLVEQAEKWRWSSLWRREFGDKEEKELVDDWPISRGEDYLDLVNRLDGVGEIDSIRRAVNRGRPYGDQRWLKIITERFKLESTLKDRGRPKENS